MVMVKCNNNNNPQLEVSVGFASQLGLFTQVSGEQGAAQQHARS